jgi:hypothetical protein
MTDERFKKVVGEDRENRAMKDRAVTENRVISDDDRVAMFRQQFFQSSLPDLPKIPGWHMCWLTTTNPRDSIQTRIRLGYEQVKPEDVPGWEYATIKTGDWQGFIGVNEMLAFKLPISLYERYMLEAHHDAPLREEEKLSDTAAFLEQQAKSSKSRVTIGEGNMEIGQNRQAIFNLS